MNESIHGERTASEPQDRVTELIEQPLRGHLGSSCARHCEARRYDLQPIFFDAILDSATSSLSSRHRHLTYLRRKRPSQRGGARRPPFR